MRLHDNTHQAEMMTLTKVACGRQVFTKEHCHITSRIAISIVSMKPASHPSNFTSAKLAWMLSSSSSTYNVNTSFCDVRVVI